jgi:UDP-2,4-diacetamido-2,4,6-trideoxy-beta-L-altropyranose hydrolase
MILFRAEGNTATGLGHIYRILSLIDIVNYSNLQYTFAINNTSCTAIIPKEVNMDIIDGEDEFRLLSNYKDIGYKLLILDGYQFDSNYQKKAKELDYKILYIDDLAKEYMYADAVINHSAGLSPVDFKKSDYTNLYLGTAYSILRKAFLDAHRTENKAHNQIFINFGGADPLNILGKVLPWIIELNLFDKIIVVTGKAYVKDLEVLKNEKVSFYQNIEASQMAFLIRSSAVALVPSSTILYEVCALNRPVISGYFVENQEKIYHGFLDENLIIGVGDFKSLEKRNLISAILKCFRDKSTIVEISNNQKIKFDGKSGERILSIIKSLL